MGKKKGFYSTNPDFEYSWDDDQEDETLLENEQLLEVQREKKGRGGKEVVIVRGFVGSKEDLKELGKKLKSRLGVGGSVKDGEIIIQGGKPDKVYDALQSLGYSKSRRTGG